MKKILFLIVFCFSSVAFSQLKDQIGEKPSIYEGITNHSAPSLILGFFNPNNFKMSHSYNLSYSSFSNNGLALGVYTNSMFYKFNDKLNVQVDASLMHSPYNTFGKEFSNQINGLYISKAALNYRPFKDFQINVQYRRLPFNYYNGYYNGYSRFNDNYFEDDFYFGR